MRTAEEAKVSSPLIVKDQQRLTGWVCLEVPGQELFMHQPLQQQR